jgi:hypothetical protein
MAMAAVIAAKFKANSRDLRKVYEFCSEEYFYQLKMALFYLQPVFK